MAPPASLSAVHHYCSGRHQGFVNLGSLRVVKTQPSPAVQHCCALQGFPAETWPVQLGLLDDINVYQCWTWCVFAVASAMIGELPFHHNLACSANSSAH